MNPIAQISIGDRPICLRGVGRVSYRIVTNNVIELCQFNPPPSIVTRIAFAYGYKQSYSGSDQQIHESSQHTVMSVEHGLKRTSKQRHIIDSADYTGNFKKPRGITDISSYTLQSPRTSENECVVYNKEQSPSIENSANTSVNVFGASHQSSVIDASGTDNGDSQNKKSSETEYTKFLNVIRRGKLSTEHTICMALTLLKKFSDKSFIKDIIHELCNDITADMSEEKFNSLYAINVANDIADFVKGDWLSDDKFYIACHKFLDYSSASRIITMFSVTATNQHRANIQSEECSDTIITHLDPTQASDALQVHDELISGTFVMPQNLQAITSNVCIQSHDVSISEITLQDVLDVIEADNRETCYQSTSIEVNSGLCSMNSIKVSEYWPEQVRDFIMHSNTELSNMMKAIVSCQVTPNQLIYYRLKLTKERVKSEIIGSAISYVRSRVYKFKESDRRKILAAMRDSAKISRFVISSSKSNRKLRDTCYTLLERSFADTVLKMLFENASTQRDDIDEFVYEKNIDGIEESIKQGVFNAMFVDDYSLPELLKSGHSESILEAIRQIRILPYDFIYTRKTLLDLGVSKHKIRDAFSLCKKRLINCVCCNRVLQQYFYAFSISEKVFKSMPREYINNKTFLLFTRIRIGDVSHELVKELRSCLENDIGKKKADTVLQRLENILIKENPSINKSIFRL